MEEQDSQIPKICKNCKWIMKRNLQWDQNGRCLNGFPYTMIPNFQPYICYCLHDSPAANPVIEGNIYLTPFNLHTTEEYLTCSKWELGIRSETK